MLQTLEPNHALYPKGLGNLTKPPVLSAIGNLALLQHSAWLAIFCSSRCPARLIIAAQDLAREFSNTALIGGFHSPVEREILRVALQGQAPIIICPPRGLVQYRISPEFKLALKEQRLLLLSPFSDGTKRSSTDVAWQRNLFVGQLATTVLVIHGSKGSQTEKLAVKLLESKPVYVLQDKENTHLLEQGASVFQK